jgi:hypothetical protein
LQELLGDAHRLPALTDEVAHVLGHLDAKVEVLGGLGGIERFGIGEEGDRRACPLAGDLGMDLPSLGLYERFQVEAMSKQMPHAPWRR